MKRILIANRGEIALRVIKTCRKLSIETVGVMSASEQPPAHCKHADFFIQMKGDSLADTYLSVENIIKAAVDSGSDGIHPGYGFLSENPLLSKACEQAGIIFIGPSADTLERLGKKDLARALAQSLDIPVVSGYSDKDQSLTVLKKKAIEIGFPVLIKASAGGGGRGMRRVDQESELEKEIESAKQEAKSFFSSDELIIEKLIENPRHIEVQIIADSKGNTLHLFERDCSIQRRYQKVIEIAPAPSIKKESLQALYKDAVSICSECNLQGAATVEFLWSKDDHYFLEVNPRIQVEHPVTESITGLDLIELQIIVARGERLPITQNQIKKDGCAIQARVYAEIPEREYIPGVGLLEGSNLPAIEDAFTLDKNGLRFDFAVENGEHLGTLFDPLIAKVICYDSNFNDASKKLQSTLEDLTLWGLGTNVGLLRNLAKNLREKQIEDIKIEEVIENTDFEKLSQAAFFLALLLSQAERQNDVFFSEEFWRETKKENTQNISYSVSSKNIVQEYSMNVSLEKSLEDKNISFSGSTFKYDETEYSLGSYRILKDCAQRDCVDLTLNGYPFEIKVISESSKRGEDENKDSRMSINSPLPGVVLKILKENGASVKKGETIIVLESMKIEHQIKAPRDCSIKRIHVAEGNNVKNEEILFSLES